MACMTTSFMGTAVVAKTTKVVAKKNVAVVANLDGVKKVRVKPGIEPRTRY